MAYVRVSTYRLEPKQNHRNWFLLDEGLDDDVIDTLYFGGGPERGIEVNVTARVL